MLKVVNLVKTYKTKKADTVYALNGVSIDFPETGLVFLLGKSGSGKSTLLNAIGGLDVFDSGEIVIKGKSSKDFSQSDFDSYRNTFIGFIFQEYNILENFTVAKNLELALELQGKKPDKQEVNKLLEQVDMLSYANRKPNQLSGGQKQRVAIARALIKNPEIIMADEPTGALDSNTGKQVMETLKNLSKEKLVIIVSHDREFAEIYGDRIIELKDGKIIRDLTKKEIEARQTESGIKYLSDDLVYIKKGQKISDAEALNLTKMILQKSSDRDMFLSFDDDANKELKSGAKINESGNKEEFSNTLPEDVKTQEYNGKNLKLIKSHLKFSDSFKMGASSLKTKVAKLVFTILLSFFAFTVFGLVDTFSTWNRATSVWQGVEYEQSKYVILSKEQKHENYSSSTGTTLMDLENLREKFPKIEFVPIYGSTYSYYVDGNNIDLFNHNLKTSVNPVWSTTALGVLSIAQTDLNKYGLTIEGSLPTSSDEIAITKHLWETIQHNCEGLNSWSGLKLRLSNYSFNDYLKVVGIVDDKVDLGKYENLTDSDFNGNDGYSLKNSISNVLKSGFSNMVFLSQDNLSIIKDGRGSFSSNYFFANDANIHQQYSAPNALSDIETNFVDKDYSGYTQTNMDIVNRFLVYYKGGIASNILSGNANDEFSIDDFKPLQEKEVLVPDYWLERYVTDYQRLIETGELKFKICGDYEGEDVLETYTVIGTTQNMFIVSDADYVYLGKKYNVECNRFIALLSGTNEDESFIKYCETFDENGCKFPVQNSATSIFDMFENIITTVSQVFFYVAIVFAVFASFLLMSFISNSVNSKKREIGVLRALGARGSDIYGIFFNESSIIAFINFALSALATFVASTIINSVIIKKIGATIVLLNFSIRQVLLILAVSWGSAIIASFIPSFKISKKRPIDAINNR